MAKQGEHGISWTDETWSPVTGCSHVSEGCRNCYAERMDRRQMWPGRKDGFKPWTAPNAEYNVRLHPERLDQPLRWKKPRRVFVCSVSDLFHELVPDEYIDRVFTAMYFCPQHTFQILTKRPKRMRDYLANDATLGRLVQIFSAITDRVDGVENMVEHFQDGLTRINFKNCWLGVSAEDQKTFDERVPLLLKTPAAVRFVSLEPLLGPVDLACETFWDDPSAGIQWVIVGGESGPGARPMHPEWVRDIRDQCVSAGVPFFFKQGSKANWKNYKDFDSFPDDLKVREYPK